MNQLESKLTAMGQSDDSRTYLSRFEALSRGVYPLSDERLPEVFESNRLSCEVDVNVREHQRLFFFTGTRFFFVQNLRELQKDLGELGHKKKSATRPEEVDELLEKYDV